MVLESCHSFPTLANHNTTNRSAIDFVMSSKRFNCFSLISSLNYFSNITDRQLSFMAFFSIGFIESNFKRMSRVMQWGTPLKILNPIINLNSIFMIYLGKVIRIWKVSLCNKTVYSYCLSLFSFPQGDIQITSSILPQSRVAIFKNFKAFSSMKFPFMVIDSPFFRHRITLFVSFYIFHNLIVHPKV